MRPRTYMRDHGDNDVKGLVITETDDDELRVTENRDGDWCAPFWMPESEVESHDTETVKQLSEDRFERVLAATSG